MTYNTQAGPSDMACDNFCVQFCVMVIRLLQLHRIESSVAIMAGKVTNFSKRKE